nr:reverse transcriptase domain-containing protein [Tanacetum cinerariifolium]
MFTYSHTEAQSWSPSPRAICGTANTIALPKILTMSTNEQTPVSQPTSAVRNTLGKEQVPQELGRPASDAALRDSHIIIAEKVHQEKVQQEKLKAVKARLNFEEAPQYSESGTPSRRRSLKERLSSRHAYSMSGSLEPRHDHSESPRKRGPERRTVFKRLEKGVFHRIEDKGRKRSLFPKNVITKEHPHEGRKHCRKAKVAQKDIGSQSQRGKGRVLRTTCPNRGHIKTYDESEDLEDHLIIFQAATKTECWAMQTWCHMFNSMLTRNARVWFDGLPKESIDSYDDLKEAFLENYLQQKKCIKDPVEIHNIKQRDGESTEEFVRRYKLKCRDAKGAPECMKTSRFMHGITNLELIKWLHDKIPKSVDEMMKVTTAFLRGKVVAFNWEEDGTEGPMIIKAEMGGHFVHRMYVDKGSSSEILYEHYFNRFRPEVNITIQRNNRRPRVKRIQAVPSTAYRMLKFPGAGETVTLRSNMIIPLKCTMVLGPGVPQPVINQVAEEEI